MLCWTRIELVFVASPSRIQKLNETEGVKLLSHDEKAIQIMKDFVEGKIDIKIFKHEFDNNVILKKTLEYDPLCPQGTYYLLPNDKNVIRFVEMQNWLRREGQLAVWGEIRRFLSRYNYAFTPTPYYENRYNFLLDIQPNWLDILDEDFLNEKIISKAPEGLTKTKRIAWCKAHIKELFRYEKSWPRWIQSPEWPILNGKPLVFKKQIKNRKDTERTDFVFYNPDTGEEHVVTQWY